MTQNNLASAYSDRIRGERVDNLELAIAACLRVILQDFARILLQRLNPINLGMDSILYWSLR